jgi:UDP-N-acetylglucosamine pyrophosphorylase
MTSFLNHDATVKYFEEHNYFDYPKDKIHFFTQDKLPILNTDGKILLSDKTHILYGPNGNGNVYAALKNANLIDYLKTNNIEKVLFVTVDNVMSKIVDYSCIGCSVLKNSKLVTKTLFKEDDEKKDWVYCLYDNKPFILPGSYQTDEIKYAQDNEGNYLYRDINITYHIIDTTEIDKYSNIDLKYHRAYKKNKYMDLDGNIIDPVENNLYIQIICYCLELKRMNSVLLKLKKI